MLAVLTNLNTLAKSELVAPVRDLINIAKDVEDQIRKSRTVEAKQGGLDGDRRLPMDAIGAQWRLELPSGVSGTASNTNRKAAGSGSAPSKRAVMDELPFKEEDTSPTD